MIGDCQRGCRLFDTLIIQNSIFAQVDEAIALPNCQRCTLIELSALLHECHLINQLILTITACSEAYGSADGAVTACFDGCTNAQREYHARSVVIISIWLKLAGMIDFQQYFLHLSILSSYCFNTSVNYNVTWPFSSGFLGDLKKSTISQCLPHSKAFSVPTKLSTPLLVCI